MKRVDVLPVLRAIAAVLVCIYHFLWHEGPSGKLLEDGNWLKEMGYFGIQGVYIFFVISGFIIPYALFQSKYHVSNYWTFLLKRLARLHPPYLVSILLMGVVTLIYAIWWWKPFEMDWHRIGSHIVFLIPFTEKTWYSEIYWTLAIEFQYYLVIGLLFPLFASSNKKVVLGTFAAFMLSCFFIEDKRLIFHYAPVFSCGIAIVLWKLKRLTLTETFVICLIGVAQARYEIAPATAMTCIFTSLVIAHSNWRSKVTDFFGEISYSLYLTHGFIGGQMLYFLEPYFHTFSEKVLLVFLSVMASQMFAWIFWKLIEVPSMKLSGMVKYKRLD